MPKNQQILETKRLILEVWTQADADALFEIMRDARVMRYLANGLPYTFKQVEEFLIWAENYQAENGFCRWKVIEKVSGEIVGSCGFARPQEMKEAELGYFLSRKHWGKGFATEAAFACKLYGFEKLGFREIIGITDLENIASQKVLEKIGFAEKSVGSFRGEETLIYLATNPENNL